MLSHQRLTSLDDFLQENCSYKVYVLRPQKRFLDLVQNADQSMFVRFNKEFLGNPYNKPYLPEHKIALTMQDGSSQLVRTYYCSQLVRELFNIFLKEQDAKLDIMPMKPMNFAGEEVRSFYRYNNDGAEPPYGELGVSPRDFTEFNFNFLGRLEHDSCCWRSEGG